MITGLRFTKLTYVLKSLSAKACNAFPNNSLRQPVKISTFGVIVLVVHSAVKALTSLILKCHVKNWFICFFEAKFSIAKSFFSAIATINAFTVLKISHTHI